MKIKSPLLLLAAITLAFVCFTMGFYYGRRNSAGIIRIYPANTQEEIGNGHDGKSEITPPGQSDIIESSPEYEPVIVEDINAQGFFGKININEASAEELADLPNIGEVIALRIVAYREKYGRFMDIDEIMLVEGIGQKRYDEIKDFIIAE